VDLIGGPETRVKTGLGVRQMKREQRQAVSPGGGEGLLERAFVDPSQRQTAMAQPAGYHVLLPSITVSPLCALDHGLIFRP
jgi:hypothetical protein